MEKLQKLVLCVDLAGCPNRCRHCWIGHSPNPNLTPDDLRTMAAAFRPYTEKLEVYDFSAIGLPAESRQICHPPSNRRRL